MFKILMALPFILSSIPALACGPMEARSMVQDFFVDGDYNCRIDSMSDRKNGIFSDDYYAVYYFCEGSFVRTQTMYVYIDEHGQCYMK